MKLKEKPFHQLWCKYAKEGKTKEALRQALGLIDVRPLNTRRARLAAQGYTFPELPCSKAKDTQLDELTAIPGHGRNLHSTQILIFAFRMILAKNDVSTCLTLNLAGNC